MRNLFFASSLALSALASSALAQEACSSYVVKQGDSLRAISVRVYGTSDFRKIYNANKDAIGKDPNIIRLGMTLQIPCVEKAEEPVTAAAGDAEKMAREMSAELIAAAEARAAEAIAEAEARVASAKEAAEGAAATRDAAATPINERQILLITGGNYAPFTDEDLPNRGLYTKLVETAFLRAAPEQAYKIQFVNDWSSHLDLLMPTLAFDATFPWSRPNCEEAESLSEKDRARCETYNFSNPFYEVVDTYFARNGSGYEEALSHSDFAGTTICRPEGWALTHMNAVGLYEPAITLSRPVTPDDCFEQVMEGRADIVAIEAHLAAEAIARLGLSDDIIENPNLAAIKSLNVMTHKNNPDGEAVLEILNRGLSVMQKSGEWRDIVSTALRHQMDNSQ